MWQHAAARRTRRRAAIRLASWWRGHCVRENLNHLSQSASKLVAWWRRNRSYSRATLAFTSLLLDTRRRASEQLCATVIQRAFRFWRRRGRGIPRLRGAAIVLQSHIRRWEAQRFVDKKRNTIKAEVAAYFRNLADSLKLPLDFKEESHQEAELLDENEAASRIQSFFRHRRYLRAVNRIQRTVRWWLVLRNLKREHDAATSIQVFWRGRVANEIRAAASGVVNQHPDASDVLTFSDHSLTS